MERALSLDIEVAARPGGDLAAARADLDAFTDVAATFAGDQPEPTLGAFLAYLAAAQQEEFGLETGRVGETDTVKLLTVHAAKGLQWPAVFIPGLAGGRQVAGLPGQAAGADAVDPQPAADPVPAARRRGRPARVAARSTPTRSRSSTTACAARDLAEERRLAYVAATRAAFWLGCSGYWWGDATSPLGPSVVPYRGPRRVRGRRGDGGALGGPARRRRGQPAARPGGRGGLAGEPGGPPLRRGHRGGGHGRRGAPGSAAGRPARRRGRGRRAAERDAARCAEATRPSKTLTQDERELVAAWELDTGLLLAERDAHRARGDGPVEVVLPARLSVSALVALARDPDELARQVRRPMPQPPARQARRGTAFHLWLEERFGQQRLIDDEELFLDEALAELDDNLIELKARFEAGEWGGRWPRDVEVPFDTQIGDRQIRGRIDAVFADPDGGYDVVDWKTGQAAAHRRGEGRGRRPAGRLPPRLVRPGRRPA